MLLISEYIQESKAIRFEGQYHIIDVNYRDISNVHLKRGMFSTEICLNTRNRAEEFSLPAVDKQIAQEVINLIQKGIQGEL